MTVRRKKLILIITVVLFLAGIFLLSSNISFAQETNSDSNINGNISSDSDVEADTNINADYNPKPAENAGAPANDGKIAGFINWILYYVASFFGWLVGLIVNVLVNKVVVFNDFLNVRLVKEGWRIVRDICNNFFIVILLVIAVGTILRVPNYQYKQLLPKLLIMAVLINFSKMITGVLIDFFQIIMVFFGGALVKENAAGVILASVGLYKLYLLGQNPGGQILGNENLQDWDITIALFFAIVISIVACVAIGVTMIILVYRIVMLWILVILSPAAYFLSSFPKGQQYAGMWWSQFASNLVVGPVLLFFLYLSFFSGYRDVGGVENTRGGTVTIPSSATTPEELKKSAKEARTDTGQKGYITGSTNSLMATDQGFFDYLIIIALMIAGLAVAQKAGAAGGQWAGKGVASLQKWGKRAAKLPLGAAKYTAKETGRKVAGILSYETKSGKRLPFIGQWAGDIKTKMEDDIVKRRTAIMKKIGMGDKTKEWIAGKKEDFKKARYQVSGRLVQAPVGAAVHGAGGAALGATIGGVAGGVIGIMTANPLLALGGAKAGAWIGGAMGGFGGILGGLGKKPLQFTVKAAELDTKTVKNAKRKADALNDTTVPVGGTDESGLIEARSSWKNTGAYIGAGGILSKENKKMLDNINDDGLAHLSQAIDAEIDPTKKSDLKEAFTKMLAAYKKGGGSNLSTIQSFLGGGRNVLGISETAHMDPLIAANKVDVASRRTGTEKFREQRGDLKVARFSHLKDNTEAGVDFRDLFEGNSELLSQIKAQQPDFDISQSGIHIEGKEMTQKVSQAMAVLIDKELASLSHNSAIASTGQKEQIGRRMGTLRTAREQLTSGRLQQLQLWNSGLENETGEAATTIFHERIHKAGVKSEVKAEEGARFIRERHLAGLHEEIAREMVAMEGERGGDDYTMDEVMARVKEKHGTKDKVKRLIAREQEAGVAPGKTGAKEPKPTKTITEAPELERAIQELTEALTKTSRSEAGGVGPGGALQPDLQREAAANANFFRLLQSLREIEKGVAGLGDKEAKDAVGVVVGLGSDPVPLDAQVTAETVKNSLS
ncbi:MAG: hypothetical protein WC518_00235 [Patescibacteria group bacterium]